MARAHPHECIHQQMQLKIKISVWILMSIILGLHSDFELLNHVVGLFWARIRSMSFYWVSQWLTWRKAQWEIAFKSLTLATMDSSALYSQKWRRVDLKCSPHKKMTKRWAFPHSSAWFSHSPKCQVFQNVMLCTINTCSFYLSIKSQWTKAECGVHTGYPTTQG